MRVGVHNAAWRTLGGGERHACGIVDALTVDHVVEMVGPDLIDLDEVRDRLGVRLEGVTFRRCGRDPDSATVASADYDLFINHSYRSTAASAAPVGIYSVMFPDEPDRRRRQRLVDRFGIPSDKGVRILGRVERERGRTRLAGAVTFQVPEHARALTIDVHSATQSRVRIVEPGSGGRAIDFELLGRTSIELSLEAGLGGVVMEPLSDDPAQQLELTLMRLVVDGDVVCVSPAALQQRLTRVRRLGFLASYDRVIANSEYTSQWTKARWGRCDEVVTPPVAMHEARPKERLILALGRFFSPERGHSKRQLELVEAFRRLVDSGIVDWRFVLIGGCNPEDRDYAMQVRRALRGLPGEVLLNADRDVVDRFLGTASIFWHATGLGTNLQRHPEQAEHFGIAPIEAMSAGAVPVVFGAAGPADVVVPGVSGFHFSTIDDLVAMTRRLISDDDLRLRLSAGARERAHGFDEAHFADHVRSLVASAVDAAGSNDTRRMG
ncbi:MAG: glycosyltransferase [Ilumatobacteraceae bacterium]